MVDDLNRAGYGFRSDWFAPHFEFRFPPIGSVTARGIHLELRHALEPWNVLGEEASSGGTARSVDSSVERLQVKVTGMVGSRFAVLCNGRPVPLHPTGKTANSSPAFVIGPGNPPRACIPIFPFTAR